MKKDPTEQMIEPWKSKKILKTRFEIRPRASFKVIKKKNVNRKEKKLVFTLVFNQLDTTESIKNIVAEK